MRQSAPPVPLVDIRELWLRSAIRPRSRHGRAANLRPVRRYRKPYPDLFNLACAVLCQAGKDATPEQPRGGERPKRYCPEVRRRQFQALIWLASNDEDLLYWAKLADYPVSAIHHRFRPALAKAIEDFPRVAEAFNLRPSLMEPCA